MLSILAGGTLARFGISNYYYMENILVPVDFSAASAKALSYAFNINTHFISKIQVLHFFDMPIVIGANSKKYLKNFEAYRHSCEDEVWTFIAKNKGQYHYDIEVFTSAGGHHQGILEFTLQHHPDLIIIGNTGGGIVKKWLFGSVARYLLTHPPVPVMAVPLNYTPNEINNILFATDLSEPLSAESLRFLKMFVERTGSTFKILHARSKNELCLPNEVEYISQYRKNLGVETEIQPVKPEQDISGCINENIKEKRIDLLITIPHEHTWMDRLFIGTETSELTSMLRIPIMSMPSSKPK